MSEGRPARSEEDTNLSRRFDHYWQYAKLWRTWVIGIAAGALFILLNKDVGGSFECRATVAVFFIVAAGLQVVLAWVNKTSAYYEYGRDKLKAEGRKLNWWVKLWCRLGVMYCIDFVFDFFSLVAVSLAVYVMITDIFSG